MRKKQTLTKNQQLFKKEVNRIKRFISKTEKRGYFFDNYVLPQMPKRVTAKTLQQLKSTRPKDLYEKAIYVDRQFGDVVTGIEARKQENRERAKKSATTRKLKAFANDVKTSMQDYAKQIRKPKEIATDILQGKTDLQDIQPIETSAYSQGYYESQYDSFATIVIANYREHISHYPSMAQPILNNWLDKLILEYEEENVAEMLEYGTSAGIIVSHKIAYNRDLLLNYMAEMNAFLPNTSPLFQQELMEAFEYGEGWD